MSPWVHSAPLVPALVLAVPPSARDPAWLARGLPGVRGDVPGGAEPTHGSPPTDKLNSESQVGALLFPSRLTREEKVFFLSLFPPLHRS